MYRIINSRVQGEILYTEVEFTFTDGAAKTVEVAHFKPQGEADILKGISNREVSEQRIHEFPQLLDQIKNNTPYVPATPGPALPDPEVLELREQYRQATHQLCAVAGVELMDKLTVPEAVALVQACTAPEQAIAATQLSLMIYVLVSDLRRKDGDDAWDRI
jgi:hypothetical protein